MFSQPKQRQISSQSPFNSFIQKKDFNNKHITQFSSDSLQSKLTIGAPDDVHEKEADPMSAKVMRMQKPEPMNFSFAKNSVKRKCSECENEEKLNRKESSDDSTSVATPIVHDVLSSSGKSLDADTRAFVEPRFNYDFSNIKIHDNELAAKSAGSINALAYTSGNNVVFNSGQYKTNSDSGKRLLAHELTHVVQQNNSIAIVQRQDHPEAQPVLPVCPVTAITPYGPPDGPPVGNEGMTAATIAAMECLQNAVTTAGGTMHVTTRYRSQAYQDHLVEVWDKVNAPAHIEAECEAVRQNYATERATHFPMGAPARGVSNHTNGNAFDATVTLPAGANLSAIKEGCNLTTPVAGEPWHYET